MFCPKCGNQLEQGNSFCSKCGAAQGQPMQSQPMQSQPMQSQPMYNSPAVSPVIAAVKGIASSPLFLTAVIIYTLSLLLSFANSLAPMRNVYQIMQLLNLDYYMDYYIDYGVIAGITTTFSIIGMIPSILMALGLWLTFAASKNNTFPGFKTAGLTIIKVLTIISLVWVSVAAGLLTIVLIVAATVAIVEGEAAAMAIVLGVILVAVGVTLSIVYYAKIVQTINAVKNSVMTGMPNERASRFVAVCCFIMAAGSAISIIPLLINAFGLFGSMTSVFSAILNVAVYICFGIIIFKYRNTMKSFQ